MITWFKRKKVAPMNVAPGDLIRLHYHDGKGRHEIIEHPITETSMYDTLAIGKIENELGFEEALVGAVGREASE
jgi:hypothetical protein